jgi:AbrB family looped-hinge helix DNA binding protein
MQFATRIATGGRIVIPVECRRALELRPGDEVLISLEDGELRLSTREQSRKRARDYVRSLVPRGVSLAAELIRDRKAEAARD